MRKKELEAILSNPDADFRIDGLAEIIAARLGDSDPADSLPDGTPAEVIEHIRAVQNLRRVEGRA